jgi:hypothetical protein
MIRAMVAGALFLTFAVVNQAGAQPGNGQLAGRSVLAVKGCGRQPASFAATVAIDADGTWSGQDSEGEHFAGTWTPKGVSGRKLEVAFDPETEAALVAALVSDIALLCDASEPITVSSVTKKVFRLTVNRKRTRAALVLRYAVKGSAGGRSGTARYRVKAKGPWTPTATSARHVAPTWGGEARWVSNGSS